jgi:hypothetical protein
VSRTHCECGELSGAPAATVCPFGNNVCNPTGSSHVCAANW